MNVAIVHYHLQRGGVAQVIRHHLQALESRAPADRPRVAVISSGRDAGWHGTFLDAAPELDITAVQIPELDYDAANVTDAAKIAAGLIERLRKTRFAPEDTVVHVHNHQLGKNVAVPALCRILAEHGFALLLQIHDFPEDFRPDRYAALASAAEQLQMAPVEFAYPQARHIHYAALNRRDAELLVGSGIPADRVHLLPNPVTALSLPDDREIVRQHLLKDFGIEFDTKFVLYPVRGIRRKNLGELLLWSTLAGDAAAFAVTVPPTNPAEQPTYEHWKALAAQLGLPCFFDWAVQRRWNLAMGLAAADYIITTSVAEGFGMVFLESWLTGNHLLGRDLPEITMLFRHAGVDLSSLSPTMNVPRSWLKWDEYCQAARASYQKALAPYGRMLDTREFEEVIAERAASDVIDFAYLPGKLQHEVVVQCSNSASARGELAERNPIVKRLLEPPDEILIERNAQVIRDQFSIEQCGDQLALLYQRSLTSVRDPVTGPSGSHSVLDTFLSFSRFHPLRVESWTDG